MVKQINRLLNEPELFQALIDNGLQEVQQYSWIEIRALWLELYYFSVLPKTHVV